MMDFRRVIFWGVALVPGFLGAAAPRVSFEEEIRPFLDTYCFACHGQGKAKGGVDLQQYENSQSVHRDPKAWENILRVLEEREMPPEGKPQPSAEEHLRLVSWIRHTLSHPDEEAVPKDPGRVTLRRLSRTEYNHTIRDLLGVESRPADQFPADGAGGGGFDNNADTLFVPPILMERYLEAAGAVLDQADASRLFLVQPGLERSEAEAARQILAHFARRAFRRPVQEAELERLLALYETERRQDRSHELAVKQALKAVLISPHFIFRVERDQPGEAPYRISQFELASRLSYFLWASMPDDALLELAEKERLYDPEVLDAQVKRMIEDPKSVALAERFVGQWLGVDKLHASAQPDPNRFPSYTVELRDAMVQEPIVFFHQLLRNHGSLLELLDADYTFANELLAGHYGLAEVKGEHFRRVPLPDRNRGGVLGMGAVLTLTSYPLRTSPVLRGKWVLEEILGTPPPPPPPVVQSLPRDDKPRDGLSFRQRLEKHREDPNCIGCHERMDPLGFALENFDAIGQWRTEIGGMPVDASGQLPSGETFAGPVELKRVLGERQHLFMRNLVERMLAYALGRGLEYYDHPTVQAITRQVSEDHGRAQTLLRAIVHSYPFQYRRNGPPAQPQET